MAESLTWKKPTPAETSTPLTSKGGKWTSCELLWWLFIFPILWLPWDHNSPKLPLCCLSSFTSFFSSESLVPQPWGAPTPFRARFSAASQLPAVSLGTVLAWSRWRPLGPETLPGPPRALVHVTPLNVSHFLRCLTHFLSALERRLWWLPFLSPRPARLSLTHLYLSYFLCPFLLLEQATVFQKSAQLSISLWSLPDHNSHTPLIEESPPS